MTPQVIASLLDRPIAFQRSFVFLGAGITGALMLSQAVYWANRTDGGSGWFFKTQDEWQAETGLSRSEQETARRKLVSLGVLQEERRGIPARLYFRVDEDVLLAILSATTPCNQDCGNPAIKDAETLQTGSRKSRKLARKVPANRPAEKLQSKIRKTTTETTAETTSENITTEAEATVEPMRVVSADGTIYEIPGDLKYPGEDTKSHKAWVAYAIAYEKRYGSWPIWNAMTGGQISKFIDRVGSELAPRVAVHFVRRVNEEFVVKQMHPVKLLLSDAEKWATQFTSGRSITSTRAKQIDQTQSNIDTAGEAMEMLRAHRAAQQRNGVSA